MEMQRDFEWDERKRRSNLDKHQVDFARAARIFEDPNLLLEEDFGDYGEQRFQAIGSALDDVFFVVYTERGERIRLITARKATKNERRKYYARALRSTSHP